MNVCAIIGSIGKAEQMISDFQRGKTFEGWGDVLSLLLLVGVAIYVNVKYFKGKNKEYMMANSTRRATMSELLLISFLVRKANIRLDENWQENLMVTPMNDGGMGSLVLNLYAVTNANRIMGSQVSECHFLDEDGVEVLASLNLDKNGELFELDVWKVNYKPLRALPCDESAYY